MIRLIAMDMDGTLLTPLPATISLPTVRILKRAQTAGIRLVMASGRMADDCAFFARDAGLDTAILALNGSCLCMHPFEDFAETHCLDADAAVRIAEQAVRLSLTVGCFCGHDLLIHDPDPDRPSGEVTWGTYLTRPGTRVRLHFGLNDLPAVKDRVSKFVLIDRHSPERLQEIRHELQSLPVSVTTSWWDNLEINPEGVDKGSCLRRLAERMGIPMEDVMAIGDNSNDLSMLKAVGLPVAMGNATTDVLQACRYRTASHDQDGVAKAIACLIFGESIPEVVSV